MSGLLALSIGLLLIALFSRVVRVNLARNSFLVIACGFIFWYWLPAVNLLTIGFTGVGFFQITASVNGACWIVLAAEIATLILLFAAQPLFSDRAPDGAPPRLQMLSLVAFASAALFLAARFASEGSGAIFDVVSGAASARESIDFSNFSSGASASLMGLWEICTLWVGLFALARHIYERSLGTAYGLSALAALTLLFAASGTRAVLMQALVVSAVTLVSRPAAQTVRKGRAVRFIGLALGLALLGNLVSATFQSRFQLDSSYRAAGLESALLDTFFVNNDMMRETSFVLDAMAPHISDPVDFILTPFSYMLPSFLGFSKNIPEHLLIYNQLRLGIDLTSQEGNAFPGLVADFWLVFGNWGLLLCGLFICLEVLAIAYLRLFGARSVDQQAYLATGLSYVFFNFRNITGAFALSLLFGAVLLVILRLQERPLARRQSAAIS